MQTKSYLRQKCVQAINKKISGKTWFERRGCNWHKAAIMSSKGIVGVKGQKVLVVCFDFPVVPKFRHWWRQMVEESSNE